MYRRGICLLLAILLCVTLFGCSNSGEESTTQQQMHSEKEESSQDTTEEKLPEKETLQEFFDNAAFIGDSVTLKLRNYNMETGALGKAVFLCQGSYSVNHAAKNSMLLSYQGKDMTPQDALKASGVNKVFILLGMNDIALFGEKSIPIAMENWRTVIDNIKKENPDLQIYIQSGTPIYTDGQVGNLTNARMDDYNVLLKEFAQKNGCIYVDIASYMKDSGNGLAKAYCSDAFVHFTDAGCKMWVSILEKIAK